MKRMSLWGQQKLIQKERSGKENEVEDQEVVVGGGLPN